MSPFLYVIIGFAIGFEAGKLASGQKCDWKKSIFAGLVALIVAFTVAIGIFVFKNYIYPEKQAEVVKARTGFADSYKDSGYVYFGNEAYGDLDSDGMDDVAFILTKDGGGSGTFFYLGAAFKSSGGYLGTNAVFLGDRIAPQPTEIRNDQIVVNYADRRQDEPMTARPSVGVSRYFRTINGILTEIK